MSQAVTRNSERPVRAYIEAKLADEGEIADLRDALYEQMGVAQDDYCKSDPHLTIIPPFTIDAGKAHLVDDLIEETGLREREIPVKGVGVWPSVKNPRVVLLDTPVDLTDAREQLLEGLRDLGATDIEDPVCPHITLFKTDNGYETSDYVKERIRETVCESRQNTSEWETEIQYVDFTVVVRLATPAD